MSDNITGFYIVYAPVNPDGNRIFQFSDSDQQTKAAAAANNAKEEEIKYKEYYAIGLFIKNIDYNEEDYIPLWLPPLAQRLNREYYDRYFKAIVKKELDKPKPYEQPVFENPDGSLFLATPTIPYYLRGGGAKNKLENLTVKELQQRCIKRKIKYSGLRKADLIKALRK